MTIEAEKILKDEKNLTDSFSRKIIRDKCGNYPPLKRSLDGSIVYPEVNGVTTNRGNKLLQKSELITKRSLNNSKPIDEECVFYNGSEHNLLQRKRMKFNPKFVEDKNENPYINVDDDDDLNDIVDVRKMLIPISSLSDIYQQSPLLRIFKSKILNELALQSILLIEKEQDSVIKYSKLLEVFLGDIHGPLYEKNLKLPEYDHNLELPDEDECSNIENNIPGNSKQSSEKKEEDSKEVDQFFALPSINSAEELLSQIPNYDSPQIAEELETARQLTQIALQRNQEFIRNLQKIRGFLVKANRIKERIYAWSKEYSGIQEEGVTVPNALRVVKRGLISATTNRSMEDENPLNEDAEEEEEAT
ncbi:hypothetical protein Kpol_376p4 [Vanderwaltozyma polyspora DSM 70294]|uniref:Transcriptional regulatory protein RXT2 N-terminal domain-containing protein n=1 Tax=Vanderwaltozyma polyspora (strain ATCC 22028 / DSM 70294 / BCRC 21397 / CBS 2163 / NBRC 10782 / NRRL Y-8283 / UCD 57-17) TaxID=436907 RepID=A7TRV4_VANPO|nr:uncharacterized protein Kpol_376p4 [Vanderwaltozyma polyspora DSM 70294]EDO14991.1 hypothetical protein Kpol_376p4 [Vanderwaltozyma polyspora DSM 70294]